MKILVACEYSGVVRDAFRARGHDAWSNDILPCDADPTYHLQGDVKDFVAGGGWDMVIAHPPCTYLTVTGNRWFKPEYAERYPDRPRQREEAVEFFLMLARLPIPKIAVENPVSIMSTRFRKPDQIVQPWQFGDKAVKKTCLWLKGLPLLVPTKIVEPEFKIYKSSTKKSGFSRYPIAWTDGSNWKDRSKTFQGIADAMAEQWG